MIAFMLGVLAVLVLVGISALAGIHASLKELVETFTKYQTQAADLAAAYNEARKAQAEAAEMSVALRKAIVHADELATAYRQTLALQESDVKGASKH